MKRVLVGSRCIHHSSYLHTYTCAHLHADTHVPALHPHALMQTTTLRAASQLQKKPSSSWKYGRAAAEETWLRVVVLPG